MSRSIRNAVAILAMVIASRFDDSTLANVVEYSACASIFLDMALMARAGYLRRRPHWTRESWRRYLTACAIPVGALLILVGMMTAFELRLPVVGEAQSTERGLWAAGMLVFMLIGAVGLATAIGWMAEGDPTKQFTRFQKRPPLPPVSGSTADQL